MGGPGEMGGMTGPPPGVGIGDMIQRFRHQGPAPGSAPGSEAGESRVSQRRVRQ